MPFGLNPTNVEAETIVIGWPMNVKISDVRDFTCRTCVQPPIKISRYKLAITIVRECCIVLTGLTLSNCYGQQQLVQAIWHAMASFESPLKFFNNETF